MEMNKETYIRAMCANLITLRAKLGLTQEALAQLAGISRQTIVAAERGKLSWNTYLSLVFVFSQSPDTQALMEFLDIFPREYAIHFDPSTPEHKKGVL